MARLRLPLHLLTCFLALLATAVATQAQVGNVDPSSRSDPRTTGTNGQPLGSSVEPFPRRPVYNTSMVSVLLDMGDDARRAKPPRYDEAITTFKGAIEIAPKEARAYEGLGSVYVAQGRLEDAAKVYEQLVSFKPKRAEAHFRLGVVYRQLGREEDARAQSRTLRELKKKELAAKLDALLSQ